MIELISLKSYWHNEFLDKQDAQQIKANQYIDTITTGEFCKTKELKFTSMSVLRMLEFGDYLFVNVVKNRLVSFAVCTDHPGKYHIWGKEFASKHGHLQIDLMCSIVSNESRPLFLAIQNFAKTVLFRLSLQLVPLNIPKVKELYESWGFQTIKGGVMRLLL